MQTVVILATFLLVAGVSAEQPQEVSNVQAGGPGPVPVQVNGQPSHVVGHTSSVESVGPQTGVGAQHHQHFTGGQMVNFEQSMPTAPQYYSPSGMIQVVGPQGASGEQQQQAQAGAAGAKPVAVQTVRQYAAGVPTEQYGQPESASIPPNYKPFGSWGLYIGGNPADGYYTNYYKALSSSVADKQQASGGESPVKPQAFVGQASGFGSSGVAPTMKQGPVYPQTVSYQDQGYYPYGDYYTPADLNSGSRVQMMPSVYSSGFASEYQSPAAMYYAADSYAATRKGGAPAAFSQKEVQAPMSPAKGYQQQQQQQRMGYAYNYASQAASAYPQSQVTVQQASYQPQSQVVAYPVPVGSQMVGSQPGADGAYQPYGVHGYTRYAVRPTVVSTEQTYYPSGVHSAPVGQFPVYKQQFVGYQQPMSFYGYPLSQLHYSSGSVTPVFGSQSSHVSGSPVQVSSSSSQSSYSAGVPQPPQGATVVEHSGPVAHGPMMPVETASSEKSETTSEADKHATNKQHQHQQQQKRA